VNDFNAHKIRFRDGQPGIPFDPKMQITEKPRLA
jgi:hypothetical protein